MTRPHVTIQDLFDWDCCYNLGKLESLFGHRDTLDARQVASETYPDVRDKVWVLVRMLWREDRWQCLRLVAEQELAWALESCPSQVEFFDQALRRAKTRHCSLVTVTDNIDRFHADRFNNLLYQVSRHALWDIPAYWGFPASEVFVERLVAALEDL